MSAPADPRELLGDEASFRRSLRLRNMRGRIWKNFFLLAIIVGIAALVALGISVVNDAFGYVIATYKVPATELAPDGDLNALTNDELVQILAEYTPNRLAVYIRDYLYTGDPGQFTTTPMSEALPGATLPPGTEDLTVRELTTEQQAAILADNLGHPTLVTLVKDNVVVESIYKTFSISDSLFQREMIDAAFAEAPEGSTLYFRSWLSLDFLLSAQSANPATTGVRVALLGSLWVTAFTMLFAFPIGIGAAIYLEEYASPNRLNRFIETNIRNLAGVPSIVYGMLGLAIFVRALSDVTGGRSILSAALTMSLLILPVIIINAQEAIRAVPSSLREASYGIGGTKWQTVWRVVLRSATARYSDRHDPGHLARDWRNGPAVAGRREHIHRHRPHERLLEVHGAADSDLQLYGASATGMARRGGGGHHRFAARAAAVQRDCHHHAPTRAPETDCMSVPIEAPSAWAIQLNKLNVFYNDKLAVKDVDLQHPAPEDHGVHRAERVRQEYGAAQHQPDERPDPRRARDG